MKKHIAIIGAGPSGLFMLKRLLEQKQQSFSISVFESSAEFGSGMPYSRRGANAEHVTNVSGNEIPDIRTPLADWIAENKKTISGRYDVDLDTLNDYKVVPRLLFGEYLTAQFKLLIDYARTHGVDLTMYSATRVTDILDIPTKEKTTLSIENGVSLEFDRVIICTGHTWPRTHEDKTPGYFDSPYPPSKLARALDHPVAIIGSSLTGIDAVRTIARCNGQFIRMPNGELSYQCNATSENFRVVVYSRHGVLPAIRFHLDDPHLSKKSILSKEELTAHRKENAGFISLDFVFENDFKEAIRKKDEEFYLGIKEMNLEMFVDTMMQMREKSDAFQFFKSEYHEAAKSIKNRESVYWKEALAVLSFAMNYPAKYFSAEDMLRLQNILMPLISVIIAFVPQHSCQELIALHEAGRLEVISCGEETIVQTLPGGGVIYQYLDQGGNEIRTTYQTYINCVGQRHLGLADFPFKSLVAHNSISGARLRFREPSNGIYYQSRANLKVEKENGEFSLKVSGLAINDDFQIIDSKGVANQRIYIMAVPFIGGFNPDYSGLDFCEEASKIIIESLLKEEAG